MLDTVISDNARLGIQPNIGVKGNIMADGAATPYDSGSPMQDGNEYLGSPDYGASFSPIVQSGGATPGGFTEYQPQGFGGGLSPYSSRSPGGYSPSVRSVCHKLSKNADTLHSLRSTLHPRVLSGRHLHPQDSTVRRYVLPIGTLDKKLFANMPPSRAHQGLLRPVQSSPLPLYVSIVQNSLFLLTIESRLMPPHPHSLPQALRTHLQALLMVLVSLRPVPATAQRVPAIVRPVPHTARPVHHIPPLRQRSARRLVSRPPAQCTVRQVPHTPLRVPTTILKPPASNKALRAQFIAPLVRWVTHLRVLNSPLDRTQGPSVHLQVHQNGRPL